jgi:5-formyltetrahydrofolate cyclo-ligase
MVSGELKRKLRIGVENRRRRLSRSYLKMAATEIVNQLVRLTEFQEAKMVFCFVSTLDEINTDPIFELIWNSGKSLAVPKCIKPGIMEAYQIDCREQLTKGAYGILEPNSSCCKVDSDIIDFAIVPCLSCDKSGFRLGHGGGYYDRYLEKVVFPTVTICFEKLLLFKVPIEKWDIKMNIVITEKKIRRC